jgi:transposase InsO family protein
MWRFEMVEKLKEANPEQRKNVLESYSGKTGYAPQALYRIARENGFSTGRRSRADKGKTDLTKNQIEFVASLIHATRREVKGPIMPVECALEIAIDNEIIDPGQISPARMTRLLRERQINRAALKAPEPSTAMRSLHPNHVHVFDVSVCVQYYLKGGKGLRIMDERDFYKNKLDKYLEIKTRLLRYVICDHFSGAFYLYYYDARGESSDLLYDFVSQAWAHKNDERYPFRGVPFILLMDSGAANTSGRTVAFLERLGIEIPPGLPYNARRQGAVEVLHNIIESRFESKLRIRPAHTVEDLNQWARDFMIYFQATKRHRRHKMTRTECWLLIQENQLRELPQKEILQDLYANPEEERTVDAFYEISYRGKQYRLKHIPGLFRGAKVMAILKPWKVPRIDISYNEQIYEASPTEMLPAELGGFRADAAVIGQEYKAPPETLTQQAVKRFENMAYGEDKKKDDIPFAGLKVFGNQAEKVGNLSFIERRGIPIEVDHSITETQISFTEFLKRLVQRIGPISKEMNRELRQRFGESVSVSEAEAYINDAESGGRGNAETKKSVAGGQ